MRTLPLFVVLSMTIPALASAKAVFLPHHGAPSIVHGEGGKSLRSHGITVWTSGMPGSRFQVIGTIEDERTDKYFDGSAIKSKEIADLVRAHGGDAVLVRQISTKPVGVERGGVGGVLNTPSFSDQGDIQVRGVDTKLVVIKSNI